PPRRADRAGPQTRRGGADRTRPGAEGVDRESAGRRGDSGASGRGPAVTIVVDASVVVVALVDVGPDGRWAEKVLVSDALAAPHLMPVEVGDVLRRASQTGEI